MYTEIEQQTLDIDWFFTDGKYIGFTASGAGKLPESVARSSENNERLVSYFRNLPKISEVIVNPKLNDLLIQIFGTGTDERYLQDFVSMTEKGLYSFDKTNLANFLDFNYHLVTSPINPITINDLPQDILNIILQTKHPDDMSDMMNINKIS